MNAFDTVKRAVRAVGLDSRAVYQRLSRASIEAALREQGLAELAERLRAAVPDISTQYSSSFDPVEYARYWEIKMRGLHAFQVGATLDALAAIDAEGLTVADIGDSSGNHGKYLRALTPDGKIANYYSVNLDPIAVDKVRADGGEAILGRAEDLAAQGIAADLFVSFETVEHLTDPLRFLHALAANASGRGALLFSVPYVRCSRFGGTLLRQPPERMPDRFTAENLHIFELSPPDWELMARLAGYRVVFTRIYRQYPLRAPMRIIGSVWRKLDFEGFICLFLERDDSLSKRYLGW